MKRRDKHTRLVKLLHFDWSLSAKLGPECESGGHSGVTKENWRANCSGFRSQKMRLSRDNCPATSVFQFHNRFFIDDMQMLAGRVNVRNRETGGWDLGGICGERNDKQFRWECRRVSAYHSCHLASDDGCMNISHASIPPSPEQEYDKYTRGSCTRPRSMCWMLHEV